MLLQLFSRKPSHKFQKLDDSSRSSSNTTMDSSSDMIATPSVKLTRASSYDYESSSGGGGISSTNSATRGGICIVGSGVSGSNNNNTRSQASSELLYDQLCNMIAQEERDGYKCCDYLSYYPGRSPSSSSSTDIRKSKSSKTKGIDEGCRTSICGWMYRVADHFAIDREVVSIALSYIDRILSTNHCADRRTFKLISATSLHLAIKVHYPHRWKEVGSLIPDLSRGDFGLSDLVQMEKELTHSLTWLLNPTTTQSIVMQILSLLPPMHGSAAMTSLNSIASTALFLSELSVCDYYFITTKKSTVAIAAYLNASESSGYAPFESHGTFEVSYQNDWHAHLERLLSQVGYVINYQDVAAARERLWSLYRQSSESDTESPEQDIGCSSLSTPRSRSSRDATRQEVWPSPTSVRDHGMGMLG